MNKENKEEFAVIQTGGKQYKVSSGSLVSIEKIKGEYKNGDKKVLHTLNDTAIATSRILVAIIENFQQKDGSIKIPKVLHKYTGFKVIK